jgi:hypothetical protein
MMMHKRISKCTDSINKVRLEQRSPASNHSNKSGLGRGSWRCGMGTFPQTTYESHSLLTLPHTNQHTPLPNTATMATDQIYRASTFAPVNIAVIKYVAIDKQSHYSLTAASLTPPSTDTGASVTPNSTCPPTPPSPSPSPKTTSAPTPPPPAAPPSPKTPSPSTARTRTSLAPAPKPASANCASYERMSRPRTTACPSLPT